MRAHYSRVYDDLQMPLTPQSMAKLSGYLEKQVHRQVAAASLTEVAWVATFDGEWGDIELSWQTVAGSGESMTVDITKNGTSILTGVFTIGSTVTDRVQSLYGTVVATSRAFVEGDLIRVARVYTAGATPAPIGTTIVELRPAVGAYLLG